VRPGSFRPPPKVHGAFVGFELRAPPLAPDEMAAFAATVHAAFAQRRKTLRNALGASWGRGRAEQALEAAGLRPDRRAQELDLEEFLRLHAAHRRLGEARAFS
jgi:16S rRNA (adenine1518-N6/adenine1519-N6)-dimethyltransferase